MKKSITAPLAIIKVDGVAIGKMKTITLTESISRGTVRGIGAFTPEEVPPLSWDGSLNCASYLIDFSKPFNQIEASETKAKSILRNVGSVEEFVDTILLQEEGITIDIMRKVKSTQRQDGVIIPQLETFASIKGCFPNRESMDLSESQIGGRNADFTYITPVIFPI